MPYVELKLQPGLRNNGTPRQAKGFWRESNLVRGYGDSIGPVPGWRSRTTTGASLSGSARAMLPWRDNSGARWVGIGTHSNAFAMSSASVITDITPAGFTSGITSATTTGGYGAGVYGSGAYGMPRTDTGTVTPATVWDLDLWGKDLLGCSEADGNIYTWDRNTANDFTAVTNAPTDAVGIIVTAELFLVAIKKNGVQWSDQGDNTVWTPAADNQAGDKDAQTSGTFRCGRRVRGATLIFSDVDVWAMTYRGGVFVYDFLPVGSGCGTISKGSPISHDGRCFWMGDGNFWQYNGGAITPLPCPVEEEVFANLNTLQQSKVFAWHNALASEIWWHYPSLASTENDSVVTWNYVTGEWWQHTVSRTCGHGAAGIFSLPLLIGSTTVYEHEVGIGWDSATPYARTGPLELGAGDAVMNVSEIVGDEHTQGDASVVFFNRAFPNGTEVESSTYALTQTPTSVRFTSRQTEAQVEFGAALDARMGDMRLNVQAGGRR